ncbi:Dna2 domain-containing protein [Cephalotus follicularis]|uniref:Dna2 domain-containing protein n=1 Tax=Cephalotus follicularis TaxID=3775 RepID=A0A1Q3C618_CEPFO|nr:Dna2 domain-containing protein [Cephalotus follicularis]
MGLPSKTLYLISTLNIVHLGPLHLYPFAMISLLMMLNAMGHLIIWVIKKSFCCPRHTVLDERLKSSEHSTAALIGTMLHQIFQAGLVKETPTISFLEEFTRTVLQKKY